MPDKPYDFCPCGCGKRWRFIIKDMDNDVNYPYLKEGVCEVTYKVRVD